MYKVLIVDDEPVSSQYIRAIIEKKCPDFEVAAEALNGLEALDRLNETHVDVVVTDAMMPQMSGIELVCELHKKRPGLLSVVVSGYQDFEYVQGAIRAGVCDYLLKPVNPAEMKALFERLKKELDEQYYQSRNQILHRLAMDSEMVSEQDLRILFPAECYYAAILRQGGLISRFTISGARELYGTEDEKMIVYGRDMAEMLLIYPEELLVHDFFSTMNHTFYKMQEDGITSTMVVRVRPFTCDMIGSVMQQLYRRLDSSIVLGKSQVIQMEQEQTPANYEESRRIFADTLGCVRRKDAKGLLESIRVLFDSWEKENCTQVYVERNVRAILDEMQYNGLMEPYQEYLLEDCFLNARDMRELYSNIDDYIRQNLIERKSGRGQSKEELFKEITAYMSQNIGEDLSVTAICRRFGISQTTLNRIFRTYGETAYNSYLTDLRVQIARKMLEENPKIYIKDVAAAVGYADQFYFSRIFRSVTGMSPTEYTKQIPRTE